MTPRVRAFLPALFFYAFAGVAGSNAAYAPNIPSNDYLNALQAVDRFAWAWAHRDAAAGAKTVAPSLRKRLGPTALADYFVGTSSPQHWAFEIGSGRLVHAGTYRFPVRLYEYLYAGGGFVQVTSPQPVTVSKGPDGTWLITTLPASKRVP